MTGRTKCAVLFPVVVLLSTGLFAKAADDPLGSAPTITPAELADGWISLFDGKTLYGWQANSDLNWSVRDGAIQADRGKAGLLLTTFQIADFEFRCEYFLQKGGNSGIFLRTPLTPKDPRRDCYELNMCDSHPAFPTGSIVGRQKANGVFPGEGRWMTMEARVEGPRIQVRLNGTPVIDFTDASPLRIGHIGLQMNGGAIAFRKIALRPLGTKDLFDGRDLDGWHLVPGSKTRFDVADGTIHASGGPGFLESNETFGDFVLQFDAKTNGPKLNSGIFFRAMAGTLKQPSNGYELQIHNGFKNGDRSNPADAGTGAIYRRTKARWVIPDDGKWFTGTLIANGPRFSIWVDGIQVTDWADTRRDDPNPRRGRRLAAGHLLLQGHDGTTDLNFRHIRAAPLP
jgi:Domain of Unknown Function (DUF1080)